MKSLTGFPLKFNSTADYLKYLYDNNAFEVGLQTHYNSEIGTSFIHNVMYELQKENLVAISRETVKTEREQNDTLFTVKLTFNGCEAVENRMSREIVKNDSIFNKRHTILSLSLIIISIIVAVTGVILSICYR